MNNSLQKPRIAETGELDRERYFESLLWLAYSKQRLDDDTMERIQYECLQLLAWQTERYNGGDSSSIRVEKAQELMTSNLFTISLWLKNYADAEEAVAALQSESIIDMYRKGRKRIDTMLALAKTVHRKLLGELVDISNEFFRSTIEGGIQGFFKLYDPDFAAHEIHITADYPMFNAMPKLAGIEFIQLYLTYLYYENMFCRFFAPADIHHLLCGYVQGYETHVLNLYEPVLLAALGCIVAGVEFHRLDLTQSGAQRLCRLLADLPAREVNPLFQNAAKEMNEVLDSPPGLIRYLQAGLPQMIAKIQAAAKQQILQQLFVLPAFPENNPKILISEGERMDDAQYRKMIEEIRECRYGEDKVAMLKSLIHSLIDLEDALLDADLNEEEMQAVLCNLGLPELLVLIKRYGEEEMECLHIRESERLLSKCLRDLMINLPKHRQDMIRMASKGIREA